MGKNGGARPGAGRPKGAKSIETQAFREYVRAKVAEYAPELVAAMIDKARGCAIIDKKDDTGERIYDLPPDPQAFKILVEQGHGKLPDSMVLSGLGKDGEITVKWQ